MNRNKVRVWLEEFKKGDYPRLDKYSKEEIEKLIVYVLYKRSIDKKLFCKEICRLANLIKVEVVRGIE